MNMNESMKDGRNFMKGEKVQNTRFLLLIRFEIKFNFNLKDTESHKNTIEFCFLFLKNIIQFSIFSTINDYDHK